MDTAKITYRLASRQESVEVAVRAAGELAMRCGFGEDARGHIDLAVREATVNAILHGNRFDPAKQVTVSFESAPGRLTISIRDQGPGLNPATVPDPLADENLRKPSGRGLLLIRTFMDKVEIVNVSPGTQITMTKFLHPSSNGNKL
jgi:serine/threonine-protein kinase RsbW